MGDSTNLWTALVWSPTSRVQCNCDQYSLSMSLVSPTSKQECNCNHTKHDPGLLYQ